MSNELSYYDRHCEERKAYQRAYYAENKGEMRRRRELNVVLEPQLGEKSRAYQRAYYLKNRAKLLERKRKAYKAKRVGLA